MPTSPLRNLPGLLALVCLALLAAAPVAAAEIRSGAADDPESSFLEPYEDVVHASASFDTVSGAVSVAATTLEPPPNRDDRALFAFLGILDGSTCEIGGEAVGLAALYSEAVGVWELRPIGSTGAAAKSVSGTTTTLSATPPASGKPFNCAVMVTFELTGPEESEPIDEVAFELKAPPPPPPPPPSPPLPPPPAAAVSIARPKPVKAKPGSWRKVKLKVSNSGTAAARKVVLAVGGARGVHLRPKPAKLKLGKIAAGASKRISFKVRLDRKAKRRSTLGLKLRGAAGVKASGKLVLVKKVKRKKKRKGRGGGATGADDSLAEKIFYRYDSTDTTHSAYVEGYAFIDDTWAYNEIPSGGLPRCTKVTGTSKSPGCVKYSYDSRTGKLKIGAVTGGKISGKGNLEIEGETYFPLFIPKAGTKYQVEQYTMGFSGLCGLITGCTTWTENLVLTSGGEFALSRSSTSTSGGAGLPFVAVGSYPPDEHGTYSIEPRARIALRFADGSVERKTIAIFLDERGKPDPANAGILLDRDYFTFAGDD